MSESTPAVTLELTLHPDDAARLPRVPELARLRLGRARVTPLQIVWHDTPDGELAAAGLSLCERRFGRDTTWRLERLCGTPAEPWPPGTPPPLVAEAALPGDLGHDLPGPLVPVTACAGLLRTLPLNAAAGALSVTLLEGTLRAVAAERPVCRVLLTGPAGEVAAMALGLTQHVRLAVPGSALAAEACLTAGRGSVPGATGAPRLPVHLPVGAAFAAVAAHLTAVILNWAPQAAAGEAPEPVHQMRVALRRLRSALALFRRAVGEQVVAPVLPELRDLQRVLGPARDWDVFTAGTGRALAEVLPDDRAVARLLAAAERKRLDGYQALRTFLASPGFRRLGIRLACLAAFRPWEASPPASDDEVADKQAAALATPLRAFAAHALSRRLDRTAEAGDELAGLPLPELHALRIQGKRLRYAAEFFAPLYAPRETRRFLRRVAVLQERLGHLNDGAVATALMAELAGGVATRGSGERGYAVGVVHGFVAAGMRGARAKVAASWRKFRRAEPFWT